MSSAHAIDQATLDQVANLEVFDANGTKVKFGSLFEHQKTIVVFIRHFICGSCQMYVQQLATVKTEALESAATKLVVVGCGEWKVIPAYAEITGFHGNIYADPTRKLYHVLGMIENMKPAPAAAEKRSYIVRGFWANVFASIWKAFHYPSLIGKQGNVSQLGGDFVFGPGLQCTYASRMQNSEDRNVEVSELMKVASVEFA